MNQKSRVLICHWVLVISEQVSTADHHSFPGFPPHCQFLSSLHPLPNFLVFYVLPGHPSVTKSCAGGVTPFWQQDRSWVGVGQEDAETWCCLFRQSKGQ